MKTAVITGGTSGIGLASAKLFIENEYNCVLVGRSKIKAEAAIDHLQSDRVSFISADITSIVDCERVIKETINCFNSINVLINSAGQYIQSPIISIDEKQYYNIFDVNVKGLIFMCRAAIPHLIASKGCIVNVASDAAIKGNYCCALYAASKGAVVAFTKSLALELADIPVRVNCVAPADGLTPLTVEQMRLGGETIEDIASVYPMKRIAAPSEVAEAIYFLASPKSSFTTGAVLVVDGGLTA